MSSVWRFLNSLEIGGGAPLLVRRERILGFDLGKRILFASDLHLRRNGPSHVVREVVEIIRRERPDVVLLGGDLVDWKSGLDPLRGLVRQMASIAPVGAVAGNHDRWIGVDGVRDAVLDGGGHWLEENPLRWDAHAVAYGSPNQKLLAAPCQVLCAHHPARPDARRGFDIVLSGHLHGGQFVFCEYKGRLYPGALAYRYNGLRFHEGQSTLLVSRGVRDTVPIRWNCPREVLSVDL